jgi:hypothetical protein
MYYSIKRVTFKRNFNCIFFTVKSCISQIASQMQVFLVYIHQLKSIVELVSNRVPKIGNLYLQLHKHFLQLHFKSTPTLLWNFFPIPAPLKLPQTKLLFFKIKAYFAYKHFKLQKCNASHLFNNSLNICLLSDAFVKCFNIISKILIQ